MEEKLRNPELDKAWWVGGCGSFSKCICCLWSGPRSDSATVVVTLMYDDMRRRPGAGV